METVYDETLPVLERIKVPMVWERLACDVRVEDMKPARYDDALHIAREYFVKDDPMCKGCNLTNDEASVDEYTKLVQLWIDNTQSFVAVQEATGHAVGILVGKVYELADHTKTMSRTRIYEAKILGKMQRFQSHINKQVDVFQLYNTEAFYKVCVWCVVPEFRDKGIGKALLRSAVEQTRMYKLPAVVGVFTGAVSQHIAKNMGFQLHLEILYWAWKEQEEPVFDNPGAGNISANLMVKAVEPAVY